MPEKERQNGGFERFFPLSFPKAGASGDTGSWRIKKPVKNADKCNNCQLCWIFCPDGVIERQNIIINYQYCKGCGICARECPSKAIEMVAEFADAP